MEQIQPPAAPDFGKAAGALVQPGGQDKAKVATIAGGAPRTANTEPLAAEVRARFDALASLRISEIARILRRGVSSLALLEPEFTARASVAFVHDHPWFDFPDEIDDEAIDDREREDAAIFLARNELGEPLDLIAWAPKSGRMGAWLGRAPALGLETLWSVRLEHDGALPVFETPWRWLAAGRDGLLLIDPPRAAPILREAGTIIAENVAFGTRLLDLLTIRPPRVLAFADAAEARDG